MISRFGFPDKYVPSTFRPTSATKQQAALPQEPTIDARVPAPRKQTPHELTSGVAVRQLLDQAETYQILRHMGPQFRALLGDINPLDGATTDAQRAQVKAVMSSLQLKVELVTVDAHGKFTPMDQQIFKKVFEPDFPATEAVSSATIAKLQFVRQQSGTHLDGKRFTLCFTGIDPCNPKGRVPVAIAHGGTLSAGAGKRVSYAEYWAVHPDFRGKGVFAVLQALTAAASLAAAKKDRADLMATIWELDPIGVGSTTEERLYSVERAARIYSHPDYDKGNYVVLGTGESGERLPFHFLPDVGCNQDSGQWPFHLVYRPQHPDAGELDRETCAHIMQSHDTYFMEYAKVNEQNGLAGVTPIGVEKAAGRKRDLMDQFSEIILVPPFNSPHAAEMARRIPEYAAILKEQHEGIRDNPSLNPGNQQDRNYIADKAAEIFRKELASMQSISAS